jgi:glycine cleavage system H protein
MDVEVPNGLLYTKTHEWGRREGQDVVVGITAHAQQELRDVVFVELPKIGKVVKPGEATAVIESVKAAFDIYAPISGTIARVNEAIAKSPQLVNQDCYGAGWLFAIAPSDPGDVSNLMPAGEYARQIEAGTH